MILKFMEKIMVRVTEDEGGEGDRRVRWLG